MDSKWFCRYEDLYCSNPFLVRTSVQKTTTEERSHRLGDGMWAAALFSSSLYGSSHAAAPAVNGKKKPSITHSHCWVGVSAHHPPVWGPLPLHLYSRHKEYFVVKT